jgi:DNA-binding NarL/FixJ family response regulator
VIDHSIFPLKTQYLRPGLMRYRQTPSGGLALASARKKILYIEDNHESATLTGEALVDRGFDVTIAQNGQDGLLAILKDRPDLVLSEIDLPRMSGFEVLERLNEIAPRFGRVPFVFLTALTDRQDELKGRQLGADDYVTKPIDFDRLLLIINARLAGVARNKLWPKRVMLNDREIEVLTWVARGKTSPEIARKLRMSRRTVDFHIDNARLKLGVQTRAAAAIKAAIGGLIKP